MQHEIRTIPALRVVYGEGRGMSNGHMGEAAGVAFDAVGRYITAHNLEPRVSQMLGYIPDDMETVAPADLRYRGCAVISDNAPLPADAAVRELVLHPGKTAVFWHKGPYAGLPATWAQVLDQGVKEAGLVLRDGPSFEVYVNFPGQVPDDELLTEICVPVA